MARVLVMMERSGVVRRAFSALGHEAWSVDLLPCFEDDSPRHVVGDAFRALRDGGPWDLVIAHPPCTYLATSGSRWLYKDGERDEARWREVDRGIKAFNRCLRAKAPFVCVENPKMHYLARRGVLRPASQWIHPYQFGEDASKQTGLWLKGLPLLEPTEYIEPVLVAGKRRWSNQAPCGRGRLGPGATREYLRSRTYEGVAEAMASQWGPLVESGKSA